MAAHVAHRRSSSSRQAIAYRFGNESHSQTNRAFQYPEPGPTAVASVPSPWKTRAMDSLTEPVRQFAEEADQFLPDQALPWRSAETGSADSSTNTGSPHEPDFAHPTREDGDRRLARPDRTTPARAAVEPAAGTSARGDHDAGQRDAAYRQEIGIASIADRLALHGADETSPRPRPNRRAGGRSRRRSPPATRPVQPRG